MHPFPTTPVPWRTVRPPPCPSDCDPPTVTDFLVVFGLIWRCLELFGPKIYCCATQRNGMFSASRRSQPYAPCRPPNAPTLRPPTLISPNEIRPPYDLTAKNPQGPPPWSEPTRITNCLPMIG